MENIPFAIKVFPALLIIWWALRAATISWYEAGRKRGLDFFLFPPTWWSLINKTLNVVYLIATIAMVACFLASCYHIYVAVMSRLFG